MNKPTSIYLDLVRFTAAVTVFFGHVSGSRLTGGLFWQMGPYGPEAVDVFFVLSGFVIAYVYDTREHSLTDYAVSRFARIYSVAIPALIVTFILDASDAPKALASTANHGTMSGTAEFPRSCMPSPSPTRSGSTISRPDRIFRSGRSASRSGIT